MSATSTIEWTDATWNPVTGCTEVSPGCDNCYAKTFSERFRGTAGHHFENGFDLTLRPERLDEPMKWRKPRRVFVNSMSDLFHEAVPDEFIVEVFARMWWSPNHTFQVLTKRHGRMRSLLPRIEEPLRQREHDLALVDCPTPLAWPLPNVWLGVSVENQKWADIRIPALRDTPAAVRMLSCEPLLGPLDNLDLNGIGWVIVGGESGRSARPMHPDWARGIRNACTAASVPFFFKQWGQRAPVTTTPTHGDEWLAPDGAVAWWQHGDGHIREGLGDYRWPGTRTVLVRRARSKKAAGREVDGRTWDEYPTTSGEAGERSDHPNASDLGGSR